MPQLNPSPWLFYLFLAWLILTFLAPSKILGHTNLMIHNLKVQKQLTLPEPDHDN
uniref:ATP synthase complex subunit 8 n=1 Tax=Pelophylax plancyi TaxID=109178 RepID=A4KZ78_PELPL|nr:ATP synthase F0 subunit 8 [Pelophylax plancyi]ABM45880.1 ATPase 8 [Pelophylax plancyi]